MFVQTYSDHSNYVDSPIVQALNISYENIRSNIFNVYSGYRRCYSPDIETFIRSGTDVSLNEQEQFIKKMMKSPHESPLEHGSITYYIANVSRALTHQLVRHRIGTSFSQLSQRYVKEDELNLVLPSSIYNNKELLEEWDKLMSMINSTYKKMLDSNIPPEDARYVLPNACTTSIIVTMNFRQLIHFFNERCCYRAQWEIRDLANKMLYIARDKYSCIFKNVGPKCYRTNSCPEHKPCGKMPYKNKIS